LRNPLKKNAIGSLKGGLLGWDLEVALGGKNINAHCEIARGTFLKRENLKREAWTRKILLLNRCLTRGKRGRGVGVDGYGKKSAGEKTKTITASEWGHRAN